MTLKVLLSLSEQQDMYALSLGALGRWPGRSELPQKATEEAAPCGAKPDLCGNQTWRGGGGCVPAHTETKQRSAMRGLCVVGGK